MKYIIIRKKKIKIKTLSSFKDRVKSIRLVLDTIDEGYYFPKKKGINTYFFCQMVNVYQVDENNKILYFYLNCKTEKFIFRKKKVKSIFILPISVNDYYKVGDVIKIEES